MSKCPWCGKEVATWGYCSRRCEIAAKRNNPIKLAKPIGSLIDKTITLIIASIIVLFILALLFKGIEKLHLILSNWGLYKFPHNIVAAYYNYSLFVPIKSYIDLIVLTYNSFIISKLTIYPNLNIALFILALCLEIGAVLALLIYGLKYVRKSLKRTAVTISVLFSPALISALYQAIVFLFKRS